MDGSRSARATDPDACCDQPGPARGRPGDGCRETAGVAPGAPGLAGSCALSRERGAAPRRGGGVVGGPGGGRGLGTRERLYRHVANPNGRAGLPFHLHPHPPRGPDAGGAGAGIPRGPVRGPRGHGRPDRVFHPEGFPRRDDLGAGRREGHVRVLLWKVGSRRSPSRRKEATKRSSGRPRLNRLRPEKGRREGRAAVLDRVVVRRCPGECYRLLDSEGGWGARRVF